MLEVYAALATIIAVPLAIAPWLQQWRADKRAKRLAAKKELLQQKNARIRKMAKVLLGMNALEEQYAEKVGELENRRPLTVLKEFRRKVEGNGFMSPNTYSNSELERVLHDLEEEELSQR